MLVRLSRRSTAEPLEPGRVLVKRVGILAGKGKGEEFGRSFDFFLGSGRYNRAATIPAKEEEERGSIWGRVTVIIFFTPAYTTIGMVPTPLLT